MTTPYARGTENVPRLNGVFSVLRALNPQPQPSASPGSLLPLFRFALGVLSSQEKVLLQLHDLEQLMLKLRHLAVAMEDTPRFFKRHVAPQRPKLPHGFGQEGKQEPPPTPSAGRMFT